ncbi:hypothetical protein MMC25_008289 [Agyrium rufum]|nr:hypothetical protein [Agyrium rufum]
MGIKRDLQDKIMAEEFSDVRMTANCQFWLLETMDDNYLGLGRFRERLDEKVKEMKDGRKGDRGNRDPLGYTTLWKAALRHRAERVYDPVSQDFSPRSAGHVIGDFIFMCYHVYWTPQREVAARFASWYKHKVATGEEVFLIEMAVPNSFLADLSKKGIWFSGEADGEEWRKLVWQSRSERDLLGKQLEDLEDYDVLIGHMASGIRKREDNVGFEDIDERNLFKVEDEVERGKQPSVQWIFQTHKAERGIVNCCKRRVRLIKWD